MQTKYILKENESFRHRLTKELVFNGLTSGQVKSFYDKLGNIIKVNGNTFKMEYPFLKPEKVRNCCDCKNTTCFNSKCYFIPNTKIKFIADIVILTGREKISQVIEITTTHWITKPKLFFYEEMGIPLIIIHSEDLLNYTKLYENLKCDKIIGGIRSEL